MSPTVRCRRRSNLLRTALLRSVCLVGLLPGWGAQAAPAAAAQADRQAASAAGASPVAAPAASQATSPPGVGYRDASLPVEQRIDDLLARMTLAEKIGQMTQAERLAVGPERAAQRLLGSVLSGGGSAPQPNTPSAWADMIDGYQKAAAGTRLGIPILYGIDAVHGHQSVVGATVFPHLMGLAATRDAVLLRRVGEVTAQELAGTGIFWNFSPMVSVTQDLRWGRAYESFGEDGALVTAMSLAYAQGLMAPLPGGGPLRVVPTAKHFLGDGGTRWAPVQKVGKDDPYPIDQGDTRGEDAALLARYLPPYRALVDAGVLSVMASFSSWNGVKMHGHRRLLTEVLKGQLGFQGFVVSDWDAIQLLPGPLRAQVAAAVNAGVDMAMVPNSSAEFIAALAEAVNRGEVPAERIDDAVRRILRAKFTMGLFERSRAIASLTPQIGSAAHRRVAREAVAKSLTLLKNDGALPLRKGQRVFVAGVLADDLGAQSGGWTTEWQGVRGNTHFPGTTVRAALQQAAGVPVPYDARGAQPGHAEVGVVVVGEAPYAEGRGDRDIARLTLGADDQAAIEALRPKVDKLVLLVIAGRPLLLGAALARADAVVMAYLPGPEGAGVADVLWGDVPFSGRLPIGWPRHAKSDLRADAPSAERCASLQWPAGFGLGADGQALGTAACPAK